MDSLIIDQEYDPAYPLDQVLSHPKNPKQHDDAAIDESIEENQFSGAILLQRSTRYCLDGHGRVDSLRRKGQTTVPAFIVDVDDRQAEKILLARNKIGENSGYNAELLTDLLSGLADAGDLLGTGYTPDEVDDLFVSFDENVTTDEQEFHGGYAESEDEKAARSERKTTVRHSIGLREVVCVFQEDQYQTFMQAIEVIGEFASTDSVSAAVHHAVVNYGKSLLADA